MLWPGFKKLWMLAAAYLANHSDFIPGKTPMTTGYETAMTILLYYGLVFSGRGFMRSRQAFNLNGCFMVHNLCLTLVSGALLLLFAQQLVPTVRMHGIYYSICGPGGWTRQLTTLYHVRSGKFRNQAVLLMIAR